MSSIFIAHAARALHGLAALAALGLSSPTRILAEPLTLDEAMRVALTAQPLLDAQKAGIRAAEEAQVAARQLPDPKLKLGLLNVPISGQDAFTLTQDPMTMRMIGVMQEFTRADKRRLRGQLVEISRRQQTDELDATQRSILRDVAVAWLDAYFSQRAVALVAAQERETTRQIDLLTVGVKTGRASQADAIAARIELDMLKDRSSHLAQQEAVARAELSRWIGPQAQRPIAAELPTLPQPKEVEEVSALLSEHPHVATLEQSVQKARAEAELAKLATKPDWNVELSYGIRGSAFGDMVTLQFGIDLPVFQKNRQLRDVAAKLAEAQRAQALKDDNLREMQSMLRVRHAQYRSGMQRLERYRTSTVPMSASQVEAALAAYRAGRGSLGAVLEARRMQLDVLLQQLMLEAETAKAQAQIVFYDQQ